VRRRKQRRVRPDWRPRRRMRASHGHPADHMRADQGGLSLIEDQRGRGGGPRPVRGRRGVHRVPEARKIQSACMTPLMTAGSRAGTWTGLRGIGPWRTDPHGRINPPQCCRSRNA
jgi:hypothetical protein